MEYGKAALGALGEGAVAIAVGGLIDGMFTDAFKEGGASSLFECGLKLGGHLALNGLALALLNRAGFLRIQSPTGLVLFAPVYVAVQRKMLRRIQIFSILLDRALLGAVGATVSPAGSSTSRE